jgi:formate hydrogenlyase subunit 6/NADH:ubiquinone oxidoreductase subunit I
MVEQMDIEGFGHCTLVGECQEACPKGAVRLTNDHRCATMTTDDHGRDASPLGSRTV